MSGANLVVVNYKGTGLAIGGVLAGEVQAMFAGLGPASPHVKSGKLKALAVTSAQASPLMPGLPPIATFVPGYESVVLTGMFAPAKTPVGIINRVNQEIVRLLARPEIRERLANVGIEAVGSSPAEFADRVKSEMSRMSKLIKDAGIRGG